MSEVLAQYRAVREDVGLIDRTDVGKLAIVGADRFTWLQGMVSNDVRRLQAAGASSRLQACILDATGHVLTDLALVTAGQDADNDIGRALGLGEAGFVLLDLPRRNLARIAALLDRFVITEDVEIIDVSDRLACLSLQGPGEARLRKGSGDSETLIVSADHTGSGGFDIYLPVTAAPSRLADAHAAGIVTVEAKVQEILRVEAGIPAFGADMDESVIALEANLGPSHISLTKGCYVGQEIIARIDSRGHTNRALTGIVFAADQVPVPGDKIRSAPTADEPAGRETGRITSVVPSAPAMGGLPIALGYVRHEHRNPGGQVFVGEQELAGSIYPLPFYTPAAGVSTG